MTAKFVNGRHNHRSPGALFEYQVKESERLGYGRTVPLYCGDKYVCRITKKEFVRLCQGEWIDGSRLRRPHPRSRMGDLLYCSVPATVAGAMKLTGLADDPRQTVRTLVRGLGPAMREVGEQTFGRTTGGKLVKGDPLYVVFPGYTNRAGEFHPQLSVFMFSTVRVPATATSARRYLALHNAPLYRAQKRLQAAWDMGVAKALHERAGVVCGPKGNSFYAMGVKAKTKRSAQMTAHLKASAYKGQPARGRAARQTRGRKRVPTYREALDALAARAAGRVRRKATQWSEERQAKFARRCVSKGFRYCVSTAGRFSKNDVYATAAHLAMPHVSPAVFAREFEALAAKPERFGVEVRRTYPDGGAIYAPAGHAIIEARAGRALWAMGLKPGGGLSRDRVARALAGTRCPRRLSARVQNLAENTRVTFAPDALGDPGTLKLLAATYAANKRQVHAVGAAAGEALGTPAFSAHGFAESLVRTSHLRALWRGLRTPGRLSHKLAVAEYIRAHGHTKLGRKALVVMAVDDTSDAASVTRIAEVVRRAKGKLLLTGPGAKEYLGLSQQAAATVALKHKAGLHL